MYSRLW